MLFPRNRTPFRSPKAGADVSSYYPAAVAVEALEGRRLLSAGPGPGNSGGSGNSGGPPAQHVDLDHGRDRIDNDHDRRDRDGGLVVKNPSFYNFYIGPKRADLNVVAGSAVVDPGRGLVLTGIMQGKIDQQPATSADDSYYVFGLNRGSAKAVAPFFQRPGIVFDSVVVVSVTHDTGITASVRDLVSGVATTLPSSSVKIDGARVRVTLDSTLLPTPPGGVPLSQYTFNLWPRSSLANPPANTTNDSFVASFLPENAMAPVQVKGRHDNRDGHDDHDGHGDHDGPDGRDGHDR